MEVKKINCATSLFLPIQVRWPKFPLHKIGCLIAGSLCECFYSLFRVTVKKSYYSYCGCAAGNVCLVVILIVVDLFYLLCVLRFNGFFFAL